MPYDPRRHHRRSVRMQGHTYDAGAFFVTICAHDRACLFGCVDAGRMIPNTFGTIVLEEWARSATLRRELENIAVVLMPNHLHGLLMLNPDGRSDAQNPGVLDAMSVVDTSLKPRMQRSPRALGAFIGGFKAAATSRIREITGASDLSVWQRGYYEHLVRTDSAMVRIVNYIMTNPLRWELDPENPERGQYDDFDGWLLEDMINGS